jgi:hypothetical protein
VRYVSGLFSATLSVVVASSALGQAVVLDQGQATLATTYQHGFVRYHLGFDGAKKDIGHITSWGMTPQVSYGATDRITFDGDATLASAKYDGSAPHGRLDDGIWHSTMQDMHLGMRMNVLVRPLFLTPFMRFTIPSHHYQLQGHTATGRGKGELATGVYAGRELPFLPKAYFEVMGSHTWVQRTNIEVASERLNRTNGTLEVGYYVTPGITVSLFGSGLRTHGGWAVPRTSHSAAEFAEHDRFTKVNEIQSGGTLAYAFHNSLTIYGGYVSTVWGKSAHKMAGPTFGFSWSPRPHQEWLARVRNRPAMLMATAGDRVLSTLR